MRQHFTKAGLAIALGAAICALGLSISPATWKIFAEGSGLLLFSDPTGVVGTLSTTGSIDKTNPFFQSLGTNGRSCATCHDMANAWSVSASSIRARFKASNGTDPLFRTNDGSNCPDSRGVNDSPPATSAYSLLLSKGLIHISLPIPANAQFTVKVVSDPYGCAMTTDASGTKFLSMYRRPLPATNLGFLSAVMFDGRESVMPLNNTSTFQTNLNVDLAHQALDATLGHAQASTAPTADQLQQIVAFELATFTAQQFDNSAAALSAQGASGGASFLSALPYYPGINDSLGGNPTGAKFNPNAFTLFSSWQTLPGNNPQAPARESIARGEAIFNTAPLTIQNVKGLNDALGLATITGTCTTCHDTPNVGDHSLPVPLDIGTSDVQAKSSDPLASALAQVNLPRVPLYALRCSTSLGAESNVTIYTSDPGRAMISGLCSDIGRLKGPILRGLAARAPYFHNGAADSLEQVVSFYNERFQAGFTANEITDLVNFLKSL